MTDHRHVDSDGIEELMRKLPRNVQVEAMRLHQAERVEEITMDSGKNLWITTAESGPIEITDIHITDTDVRAFADKFTSAIGSDNRTGIDKTLHRISVIRDRDKPTIIGVTIRFGIPMYGVAEMLRPILSEMRGLMVIGPPAVGKTTLLRDIIRILGEMRNRRGFRIGPRVIYVDTASEIGGFGRIAHPSLGHARRIPVPNAQNQSWEILQGVGNHSAEVIVVDEIKTLDDAKALSTTLQRGVKAVATCHGEQLAETLDNKTFWPVLGDIDIDPRNRERRRYGKPVFGSAAEVWGFGRLVLHPDLARSIDLILAGKMPEVELLGEWSDEQIREMIHAVKSRIEESNAVSFAREKSVELKLSNTGSAATEHAQAQDTED